MSLRDKNRIGLAAAALLAAAGGAHAGPNFVGIGQAADFAILGLGGSVATHGDMTVNSATTIVGDVGYGAHLDSPTNQKVDSFFGKAWVSSSANFTYTAATFNPTGGLAFGTGLPGDPVDGKLNSATASAVAASLVYAAMVPSATFASITGNSAINSTGDVNLINVGTFDLNGQSLTLNSRAGFNDYFVFNVSGNFDFSDSDIILNGTNAGHVLFNITGANSQVTVNKASNFFNGTILAAGVGQTVIYHNPAVYNGAIIAYNIDVHSSFNINYEPFLPVPAPGTAGAMGMLALAGLRRRR